MEYFVVSLLNGVIHGLLLFMVSAGLTLIFGMMGVLNFAHAWFYMLGAYIGFALTRLVRFLVRASAWPPVVVGLVGALIERYLLRRVHRHGHSHELLLTFGLAFIIEELIKLFYGDALVAYQMPDYMRFAAFTVFETNYPFYRLFMGIVAIGHFRDPLPASDPNACGHHRAGSDAIGHSLSRRWDTTCPPSSPACSPAAPRLPASPVRWRGLSSRRDPNMAVDVGTLLFVVVVVGGLGSRGRRARSRR